MRIEFRTNPLNESTAEELLTINVGLRKYKELDWNFIFNSSIEGTDKLSISDAYNDTKANGGDFTKICAYVFEHRLKKILNNLITAIKTNNTKNISRNNSRRKVR